ncbi:MAG: valine--tRNA ligase [Nitrososphaerales archaeon]|nr:valine--tRNA ligase [Nitrososphaerales archaeon]
MQARFLAKLEATSWDPKLELDVRLLWENERDLGFKPNNSKSRNFVLDTPPPYPSGRPWHPGALTQYAQIDMIARSARMRGLRVLYPVGIDRNGLPVEIYAERKYRVQMRKTPREEFINLCKHALDDLEAYMVGLLKTIGVSGDYENKYRTDSEEYRKLTQWSFIEMWKKGLIYVANRPNNYCIDCNTTIADAEIEYEELPTYLVTNKFKVKDSSYELPVATTRPELLVACQLVVVNPKDDRYKHLIGKTAIVPIYNGEVPIKAHPSVDQKFGSGAVMVCSYGDYNDVLLFREFRLKEVVAIDLEGKMTAATGKYAGITVKDARSQIIQDLQEMGVASKVEQVQHRTPLCERSHTPIEIIQMEEYYLKQLEFRNQLKKLARGMVFYPAMHRQILLDWIEGLTTDYPISRRRYYATEIPVWYCSKCNTPHLPKAGKYYRPWRDEAPFKRCKKCGNTRFVGETRTFDTWMDSSLSPLYITRLAKNRKFHSLTYPATIRVQGKDIVRTWLYYSLLRCYLLTGRAPFKSAWVGGLGQDAQGRAMRKSLGNYLDPEPLLEKYGADAFRFWGASEAGLGFDFRISEDRMAGAGKFLTKLWNTSRFISSFPQPKAAKLTWTDKWMLNELAKLTDECSKAYARYDSFTVATRVREFLWNVFASHYLEMAKGRAYGDDVKKEEQEAAWYTLHAVVRSLLLLIAPISPYITDHIWRKLYGERSIHLEQFPRMKRFDVSEKVSQSILEFNAQAWKTKKDKGLAMKDSIELRIPSKLKPFEKDLVRMHHIRR